MMTRKRAMCAYFLLYTYRLPSKILAASSSNRVNDFHLNHGLQAEQFWDDTFDTISNLGSLGMHEWDLNVPNDIHEPDHHYQQTYDQAQAIDYDHHMTLQAPRPPYEEEAMWQNNQYWSEQQVASEQPCYTTWQPETEPAEDIDTRTMQDAGEETHQTILSNDTGSSDPVNTAEDIDKWCKPPRVRTSPYWRNLDSRKIKVKMLKRYMELTGFNIEKARARLRTRCNPNIQADLTSGDPEAEQRAVRKLDFKLGKDPVFTETDRIKLKQVMVDELGVHPSMAPNVLCYGIAALSDETKLYYAKNGIVGDEMYLMVAKDLKDSFDGHCLEARRSYQRLLSARENGV